MKTEENLQRATAEMAQHFDEIENLSHGELGAIMSWCQMSLCQAFFIYTHKTFSSNHTSL